MGRPPYTIRESDHWFARRWLEKKLADPVWLGETKTYAAHNDLIRRRESAPELNQWCELWMTSKEWKQMKNAIRAGRRRIRDTGLKSVTLSRYAWSILDFWAQRDGCTLSEVIERRLGTGEAIRDSANPDVDA